MRWIARFFFVILFASPVPLWIYGNIYAFTYNHFQTHPENGPGGLFGGIVGVASIFVDFVLGIIIIIVIVAGAGPFFRYMWQQADWENKRLGDPRA